MRPRTDPDTSLRAERRYPANVAWSAGRSSSTSAQSGLIQPDDLPPECRTVSRRLLSPLESMECDAIVASLTDASGKKAKAAKAAKALGISRATTYREVHEYGIFTAQS